MRDNVVGLEKDGTHEQEGEGQEDASGNAVVKAKVEEDKGKIEDVEMEDMVDRLIYAKVGVDENDSVVKGQNIDYDRCLEDNVDKLVEL
ncbi:hypothetical protein PTT_10173 [Pyrenophora teres f. teres 0-1]|uniref:Uncharacterized protein n=1 Tax=Pyrenophora teres f. teres (strain 0-1) TaxID=861557 RepID=E3RNL8_PYRTT|nr:hypothetical protein PTT_10173 [Pyrenophora teres f. teres 0-1]